MPGDLPTPLQNHLRAREPSGNSGAGGVLPVGRFRGFREIRSPKMLDSSQLVSRGVKILFFGVAPALGPGPKHRNAAPDTVSGPGLAGFWL